MTERDGRADGTGEKRTDGGETSPAAAWLRSGADAFERAGMLPAQAGRMADVEVGTTPAEVVYEENKLELRRYTSDAEETHDTPVLLVYALINRPYILDLQPSRSVVRRLLEGGYDVYLIDWGEPSELDRHLTLADYIERYLYNCFEAALADADSEDAHVLGYCMGGTMAAIDAALRPERVRTLTLMAAGLCFEGEGGVLELWGDYYDARGVAETYGTVPAEFLDVGFALLDPVDNYVSKYLRLFDNIEDDEFVENFARMETWLSNGVDVAGDAYAEYIESFYQRNELYENEYELDGEPVNVENIDMPVLQIVGEYDTLVPPESSLPFNDAVGSDDTAIIDFPVGHVGLSVSSRSHADLWPRVVEWFADHESEPDLEAVSGIGSAYAERLRSAGVTDLDGLAAADAEELAETLDVSPERVTDWQEQAVELVGAPEAGSGGEAGSGENGENEDGEAEDGPEFEERDDGP
jgi:polyhydroxyalkanoate synthase